MDRRVIAFSLWGSNPKYVIGAIRNAELAERLYPGWVCVFYIDFNTVSDIEVQFLDAKTNTEILPMPNKMDGWKGMFARFLEVSNSKNSVTIIRDCFSLGQTRSRSGCRVDGHTTINSCHAGSPVSYNANFRRVMGSEATRYPKHEGIDRSMEQGGSLAN